MAFDVSNLTSNSFSGMLSGFTPTASISFSGSDGKPALTINFNVSPPTIDLHGNLPDDAARVFWDAVARLVCIPSPVK